MKNPCLTIIIAVLAFVGTACHSGRPDQTKVLFRISEKGNVYFQPEDSTGFHKLTIDSAGQYSYEFKLNEPAYYRYIDARQQYHTVYLSPGARIEITDQNGQITFSGDHAAENTFIQTYYYLGHSPNTISLYSAAWLEYNQKELDSLTTALQQSGLSPEFIRQHILYYQFAFYKQRLEGPVNTTLFTGKQVELPAHYYDFLKNIRFDQFAATRIPKWFPVMLEAFETMEKQGIVEVSENHYMEIYAQKIPDEKLRSMFLIELLRHTLQKGFADDWRMYLENIRPYITDTAAISNLSAIEAEYEKAKNTNSHISRGQKAPEFTAWDVNGKAYHSSDFAGKVIILDFWFTGCIPCRAEMPYMEKMAEDMKDQPVCFLSISLDTGKELTALWQQMVKDKTGHVLHLNVPEGFKSQLARTFLIRSVPRIVIISPSGEIIDAYAKRPSDPKLRQQLNHMLAQN